MILPKLHTILFSLMQHHIQSQDSPDKKDSIDRDKQTSLYGGQAIIEGVMMKGPERTVAACRTPHGDIVHKIIREGADERRRNFWYKTAFLRGFLILIDSFSVGYQALMFSGNVADPDSKPRNPLFENLMLIVSLLFALSIFKFIPILATKGTFWLFSLDANREEITVGYSVLFSAIEGIFKAAVLVGYILAIRLMNDIRRVFQYHGSEHKTINAYEAGADLSVDSVSPYPTFHPRCGTSFLFAVILFSLIFAMSFPLITWWLAGDPNLPVDNLLVRFGLHIFFLPIIASFGYEFIRFTARFSPDSLFMKILIWPGKMFQKITALEPDRDMLEVAHVSMHLAMGLELPEGKSTDISDYSPEKADPESESDDDENPPTETNST